MKCRRCPHRASILTCSAAVAEKVPVSMSVELVHVSGPESQVNHSLSLKLSGPRMFLDGASDKGGG